MFFILCRLLRKRNLDMYEEKVARETREKKIRKKKQLAEDLVLQQKRAATIAKVEKARTTGRKRKAATAKLTLRNKENNPPQPNDQNEQLKVVPVEHQTFGQGYQLPPAFIPQIQEFKDSNGNTTSSFTNKEGQMLQIIDGFVYPMETRSNGAPTGTETQSGTEENQLHYSD